MSNTLLQTIQTLHHRAERLEQEASQLRQELARVAEVLVSPSSVVARYTIEDEIYEITQADVEALKAVLVKPSTESALYELAVVKKMSKRLRERPLEEQNQHFFKTVEAIQAAAIIGGTAIDSEADLTIDN